MPVLGRIEIRRRPKVALPARCEGDVAANPRDPERALVLTLEVTADHVPDAVVREQRVGVQRSPRDLVAGDRPVLELHGALLGDRGLELRQAACHLRRVVGILEIDLDRALGPRLERAAAAEREVLQREAQRLGVRELALETEQRDLKRRELVVAQVEWGEEVLIREERVELLAGELVALRLERHSEPEQLAAVGVEAARERLVGHLGIALDTALDVAGGECPPLRHQEGDERELPDQLVGVVGQCSSLPRNSNERRPAPNFDSLRTTKEVWSARRRRGSGPPSARRPGAGATGSSRARGAECADRAFPSGSSPDSGLHRSRTAPARSAPRST